ncbi:unnamed protein product, partial [Phaeothamnion confervicola]
YAGRPGSSVLIFVSGMSDIVEIMDQFDRLNSAVTYKCLAIHSDIPFEEQLEAFKPAADGEVKIVIATNAAESSVTLPDVDTVVCLGTCKQIEYNPRTHRTQLTAAWISRASATQRAGRTGRVRPGRVFRLYSQKLYEDHMAQYELGEMHRQPLDAIILSLRSMLGDKVVPVLEESIEAPDMERIDRSFESLHELGFLSRPDDDGELTAMGNFVAALGVDLQIARLIGISAQFDVLPEAIVLAAALSLPRSPFRITSPLIHDDPDEYNKIVAETMAAQAAFDAGFYSEPLMLLRVLWEHEHTKDRNAFCMKHSLAHARMKQLRSTADHLRKRVAALLHRPDDALAVTTDPVDMPPSKLNLLRLVLVWSFKDSVISCQ